MMRRQGYKIMINLIGLVKPLIHIMFLAVLFGVLGFLCSIFLTTISAKLLTFIIFNIKIININRFFMLIIFLGVFRGFLRYAEQLSNHYIAFKLLAIIRNKVFTALRRLSPAKLEGRDKGNLISLITSDIELLEVFYAHTISPILIAFLTSLIMSIYIGTYNIYLGIFSLISYFIIGVVMPLYFSKKGKDEGLVLRNQIGDLNSNIYDSLKGIDELIQFDGKDIKIKEMENLTDRVLINLEKIKNYESENRALSGAIISSLSTLMFFIGLYLFTNNKIDFTGFITSVVALFSSFGPVLALSNLSANMRYTLASGERVLSLLEEKPIVEDVKNNKEIEFDGININNIKFSYDNELILDNLSLDIKKKNVLGIFGKSGSGKSTLLKLIMRFWQVDSGNIKISNKNINKIDTKNLRNLQSYVTQETHIFEQTIRDNIGIGKKNATMEEIIEASKKASIHDFIVRLKDGYETKLGDKFIKLSSGEKQRIGLARAFLHNSDLILLDEPTSNLDSLNEAIILDSINKEKKGKTIIIVSHRKSALNIADDIYHMNSNRNS